MRFLLGDQTSDEKTVWSVAPLRWWRGKRSYVGLSTNDGKMHVGLNEMGFFDILAVDTENGEPYSLKLSEAIDAFYAFAAVGKKLRSGMPIMEALEDFLVRYGVPCDGDELIPGFPRQQNRKYMTLTEGIKYDAEHAYVCAKLLKYIETRSYAKIRDMASVIESEKGFLVSFFPDFDFRGWSPRGIVVGVPKEEIPPKEWLRLAQQAIRDMSAVHAPSVAVTDALTPDGTPQLLLTLAGLSHAMWLSFRARLAESFEPKLLIKYCLQDGYHQGCGQPFVAKTGREKLCPECRAKAKALSQKKWREKRKRAMSQT